MFTNYLLAYIDMFAYGFSLGVFGVSAVPALNGSCHHKVIVRTFRYPGDERVTSERTKEFPVEVAVS